MRFDIISANPRILECSLKHGLTSRAVSKGIIEIKIHDLRDYAEGSYKQIDDMPYGGGTGMILKPEPVFRILDKLLTERNYDEVIYMSPQGVLYNQKTANELSLKKNIIFICGHYKGIDERIIRKFVTRELSIGFYVLSCGDLAAYCVIDSAARLIPGVLGDSESSITDSFQIDTGFDYPQYTRPDKYSGLKVPEILLSGDHKKINEWREKKAKAKFNKIKKINREIFKKLNS